MPGKPASAFVQGLEVRLVIDEQRFAQFSLAGLGCVMDRLFPRTFQSAASCKSCWSLQRQVRYCDAANPAPVPNAYLMGERKGC
ncbi:MULTISPECIES: hypothetical protein [unclassified Burkholderia]|uniref:hypothetical protein n=1 Tax=unclassified Burkholderia TaxID=2613784 RepID=UPI002012AB71|nr:MULTISPECIES: hypothetical protein [unclassified Burkholderia]